MPASKMNLPSHFRDWNVSNRSVAKMEKAAPARPLYRQTWFLAVAAAALVAIIVVIAVPLAVLLPKRHGKAGTAILLPLYIYPNTSTAWDPLYSA